MKPEDLLGSNEGKWRINWERDRKCCAFRIWRVEGPVCVCVCVCVWAGAGEVVVVMMGGMWVSMKEKAAN